MKTGKPKSNQGSGIHPPRKRTLARTLTLTATLAAPGTSLGVDVKTLFAAEPKAEEGKIAPGPGAAQIKIGETVGVTQGKWKAIPTGSLQNKQKKKSPPAVQDKTRGIPPALQDKIQGTPPGARQIKQMTIEGTGPLQENTKEPTTGR